VLILASRSPQRSAILAQVGIEFRAEPAEVEELTEGEPRALVEENARRKARAVEGERVLGVDTVVVLDGRALGKPRDAAEAERFLRALSGRDHEVMSGLVLREAGSEHSAVAVTRVRFRSLDDALLRWYLGTGEWTERAGGYAIQLRGALLVEEIEGDYLNVVGLPVATLLALAPRLVHG
jgi:septum formation protein